jgi:regulator of protease activity HflC (stomatin/prohibitin superfamily)
VLKRPGIYFLIPFFERVIQVVSLDTNKNTIKFTESEIEVSFEYTYQVNNPKLFVYAALDSEKALETTMKNEYLINHTDLKLYIEKMKQVALDLGIELIDVNI